MEHVLTMTNLKLKPSLFTPRPTTQDSQLLEYLINIKVKTFSHKVQVKTLTWSKCHFIVFCARQVTLVHQTKESNMPAPGEL